MSKKIKNLLICIVLCFIVSLIFNYYLSKLNGDNSDKINMLKESLKISDNEKLKIKEDREKWKKESEKNHKDAIKYKNASTALENENIKLKNQLNEELKNVDKLELKKLDFSLTYKMKNYEIEVEIDSELDLMKINFLSRKNLYKFFLTSENEKERLFKVEKSLEKKKKETESLEKEVISLKKSLKEGDELIKKWEGDGETWKGLEKEYEKRINKLLWKKWLWPVGGVIAGVLTHLAVEYIKKVFKK